MRNINLRSNVVLSSTFTFIFLGLTFGLSLVRAATDTEDQSHMVFCFDWQAPKGDGQWLTFTFRPPEGEKLFLPVGRVWDESTHVLLNTAERPRLDIHVNGASIELPLTVDEIVNPNVWYTLFYTVGKQSSGKISLSRNLLDSRLIAHFRTHPDLVPADSIVKVHLVLDVFKMDCASQRFVFGFHAKSDYILFKVDVKTANFIGYNTDSLSGTSGSAPIMLK